MNYFIIIITGFMLTFLGINTCSQQSQPKKFAVIKYQQETCTFCPGGDAGIEDWTTNGPYLPGDELIGKGRTNLGGYVGGFVHKANVLGNVEVVGINSPDFVFGGSSRSWNTLESFEYFMDIILSDLESKLPVDGVYLALHGAMAVRDIPKPEAEIAKRIRALVGPEVPIAASFDLHGNEDEEFLDWADAAFVTKRFPHYDAFLQGERSAEFLYKASKGMYAPTSASRKPPVITATVLQWTGASPAMDIMERARRWEARNKDVYVSVFYGFPWSDVPDIGTTVHVTTNDNKALADSIADDMAEYIWRVREEYVDQQFPMPKEAVQITKKAIANQQTPVALGDYSDRPGDATWILSELIDEEVEKVLYAALRDEFALEALKSQNAQPGDLFSSKVGGITGEQAGPAVQS
jgi:microcystin degradation protein MlrC